jgi:hypothetical protein
MTRPVSKARRRPKLASPGVSPAAIGLIETVGPLYARAVLKLSGMSFLGGGHFVDSVREFYDGAARLIIAFRHPYGDEPQVFMHAMHRGLPREARRLGRPLPRRPHCLFLHGYEVPLWSGGFVRWLLPRTGSMPVYHVRQDAAGLRAVRQALRDGPHPLAMAPEGQVSYRSETLPRLERGALQLGFWCAAELQEAGRAERVLVLPVSVHAKHEEAGIGALESLARRLELHLGMARRPVAVPPRNPAARRRALGLRLRGIDGALLEIAEEFYGLRPAAGTAAAGPALVANRESRRARLLEEALRRGESMLGIDREGDMISRVYRLRHEGWSRIFPEEDPRGRSPLAVHLADRRAGEAWYAMRHMETVDLGFYLDADYLEEGLRNGGAPSMGRLAETACSLADLASRLTGGNFSDRPNPLGKHVVLVAEPPLELRALLRDYRADRRGTLARAAAELSRSYHAAIKEYLDAH